MNGPSRKVVAIAGVNVRRLLRERSNVFFVLLFPLLVILVLGAQFGSGFMPRLGVLVAADGPLATDLVTALTDDVDFDVEHYTDPEAMRDDVARGRVHAAITIPPDYDESVASGGEAAIRVEAKQDLVAFALRDEVSAAVADQATIVTAARTVIETDGGDFSQGVAQARAAAGATPGVEVETEQVGASNLAEFATLGQYDLGASQQLLLFTFLTSLTASTALIQVRNLGISRRMLSTPTSARTVILGEAAGRFGVALVQSLYIMLGTWLIFRVNWGDPIGSLAVVVAFSLACAGAAMLIGSLFSNDAQAAGIGVVFGLGLAALGGAMVPLDFLSPTMVRIAHLTPHAWAMDAFTTLVRRGGGFGDVLGQVAVLAAFATVLLALAAWRLHRVTVR